MTREEAIKAGRAYLASSEPTHTAEAKEIIRALIPRVGCGIKFGFAGMVVTCGEAALGARHFLCDKCWMDVQDGNMFTVR